MQLHYLAGYSLIGLLGSGWLSVIVNLALILLILGCIIGLVLEGLDNLKGISEPKIFEINIPTNDDKKADSESLFIVLSNLSRELKPENWLLRRKNRFSFEINLTKKHGLRLIAVVPKDLSENFKRSLLSYNPNLKLNVLKKLDYVSFDDQTNFSEFRPTINPLHDIIEVKSFDSLSYFSEAALNLGDNDCVSLQAVLQCPNNLLIIKKSSSSLQNIVLVLNKISHFMLGLFITYPFKQTDKQTKAEVNTYFRGNLRLVYSLESPDRAKLLIAAMSPYKLKPRTMVENPFFKNMNLYKYQHRSTSINPFNNIWLAHETLSHLFGFQNVQTIDTSNAGISLNKELPLPVSLNDKSKIDISLGINNYHGEIKAIGLSFEERKRHLLILGGTGNGKTTMMLYAIKQDIKNGKGVAVIDPHGDLAENVLKFVPKARLKDVVYFNPSDIKHPLGLNLLELPKDIDGDELLLAQDFVTESVISILRKLFNEGETGGHRLEYILRNAIQTAFTVEGATIFTVYRLLSDEKYRLQVTAVLKDKSLKNFWDNEYGRAGNMQRVKLSIGVTSKLGRFLRSAATRRVLVQPKSTIDFEDLINNGKILICNFSKGRIGEDTSSLLGSAVMAKLQLAAYARQNIKEDKRSDFYLYIDEFQNFANASFSQLMSEARKYKLYLTLAEQSLSQQADQNLVSTILANVGSLVCFRCSSPQDVAMLLPMFGKSISSYDLLNLDSYNFYMRIAAIKSYPVFSGETVILNGPKPDHTKEIIAYSQKEYGWSKA